MNKQAFFRPSLPTFFVASILLFCHAPSIHAETFSSTGGTLSWTNTTSWVETTVPNAIGATGIFNTPLANQSASLMGSAAGGGITVGSLTFNSTGTPTMGIPNGTGGGPLIFDQIGAGPATITTTGAGAGNTTISATMRFDDSVTVTANNTVATTGVSLTGAITGSGGYTKEGDGIATLSTANKAYTGSTILNGGRLRVSASGAPTNTSSLTINAGSQLTLLTVGTYTFGSGPLNLNGTGAISGPLAAFPGAMRNDRGTVAAPITIVISNAVVLQSDALIHVQASSGSGGNAEPGGTNILAGNISGPGRLTLTAPNSDLDQGTLLLSGNNSYAGGSLVNGGILAASGASATFGTGNVIVDNSASTNSIARLRIETGVTNAIANTATLSLTGGGTAGVADQGYADLRTNVNEVVGGLVLAGIPQVPGTYGSTTSGATVQNDEFFTGSGIVTVVAVTPSPSLTITLDAPNAVLSWPTNATGFTLQELAAFPSTTPPYAWTDVNTNITPVVVSGTNNTVTVPASSGNDFFRLRN